MELLEMAARGEVQIAISPAILAETLRILRNQFGFSDSRLLVTQTMIASCTVLRGTPKVGACSGCGPDDDRIVEWAVASGSRCVVTGDKDLLGLGECAGIAILTLSEFFARPGKLGMSPRVGRCERVRILSEGVGPGLRRKTRSRVADFCAHRSDQAHSSARNCSGSNAQSERIFPGSPRPTGEACSLQREL